MSKQAIASDIFEFAQLLVSHNLVKDARSLYDASAKLQSSQNSTEWSYECGNLEFTFEGAVAGTLPQQIELVEIIFNVSVRGLFPTDYDVICNPLIDLFFFDIELIGWNNNADNFYASWHLDKNIKSPQYSYIHPEYHLTFGGNKLEEKGVDNFGASLILPSPRISHPPMDVILGVDFILQNYFPISQVTKLLNDSKYKEIVSNSIQRLWKPYYLSLSSAWKDSSHTSFEQGFEYFNLNPHIKQAQN